MTYHPLIGISIFLFFLIVAFLIGKKATVYKERRNNIIALKNKKKIKTESISPDASWID
tara:strand:+ start:310 stop:486 length:177 start_codon:yes stop_codon:yes gene_type:complete